MTVDEGHLVHFGPFEGDKQVILIRWQVTIAGRGQIVGTLNHQRALGVFPRHVDLVDKRVGALCAIIVAMASPGMSVVALPKPAFTKIGSGLHACTCTPAIEEVTRDDGVDGGDIEFIGIAGLDGVLNQGVQTNHDILETLDLLNVLHEIAHGVLALGEVHLSVLTPEVLASHAGIRFLDLRSFTLEHFLRDLSKGVFAQTGGADDDSLLNELGKLQFCNHVILC